MAALPALIQRLGRVNRRGDRGGAVTIAVHADALSDKVYGTARQQTWQWLAGLTDPLRHRAGRTAADFGPGIGASPAALRRLLQDITAADLQAMQGPRPYTPALSAVTLDSWARTSPVPHPDIPVAPYLHGIAAGEPTVSVVWRANARGDDPQQWRTSPEWLPPSADEAIELPVSVTRRWLASLASAGPRDRHDAAAQAAAADTLSDTESQVAPEDLASGTDPAGPGRSALRYRGPGEGGPVTRPDPAGDLLIVPAAWGGCDRYGWNPAATTPVIDLADLTGGGRDTAAAVRVGPTLTQAITAVAPALTDPVRQLISQITADLHDDTPDITMYRAMLSQMLTAQADTEVGGPLPHQRMLRRLATAGRLVTVGPGTGDALGSALAHRRLRRLERRRQRRRNVGQRRRPADHAVRAPGRGAEPGRPVRPQPRPAGPGDPRGDAGSRPPRRR